jgi:D-serine deaminase-like pyridoxal phosphate-dependent protein
VEGGFTVSLRNASYPSLDTPAVLIDLDKLEANIKEMCHAAAEAGIKLRPHVKIHQCPEIAKMQIAAGAHGVEVGLVDQAIVMAEAGIDDIIIAHPFYGERKLEKVKSLLTKHPKLKLAAVVDMAEQAGGLSEVGAALNRKIPVHIKVDTGIKRFGVYPGAPVLKLASQIKELSGVELVGVYAHESGAPPTEEGVTRVALECGAVTAQMAQMLRREGFAIQHVAVGGSPTYFATCRLIKEGLLKDITELHPGQRFIGDITYMMGRGNTREQCALTLLTTVASTTHQEYVVIDAGFKAFGSESMIGRRDTPGFFWNNMASFGSVQGRSDLWLGRLGAESGWLFYKDPGITVNRLQIGDRLEIVPNSASLVLNIHDKAYGVRNGAIERELQITGRGLGT